MVRYTVPFFAVAAGAMAAISLLNAQEVRATLGGRVTDSQGAVVPNATVTVISEETNVEQHTRSNPQGNWTLQFLQPGTYTFTISAQGFKTARSGHIELQAADIKQIDTRLELGSTRESVAVTAEVPLIDTTSATSGTVISQQEIEEIPSMTHISTLLATLSPGVIAQDQNNNVGHLWSYNAASQFTANGGRNNVYSNMFLLDGFPNIKSGGDIAFNPSPDTLAEFRVQTNAYDASIGRQAGATINQLSKSGKKYFSGELYEFNQNSAMNTNLFQTNLIGGAVTPVHFNEYGGMFGGPVWLPKLYDGRKKTFFFVAFDDTRNSNPLGTAPISVPTSLERNGDFSQSFTTQTVNGQLQRYPIQVYDPQTVNAKGDRQLFPRNLIPTTRLNPIAHNILGYVPLPNTVSDPTGNAVNNYVPPAVRTDEYPLLTIRADQNWNDNHRSFATLHWASLTESAGDNFGPGNIASGNNLTRIDKSLGLDHVWILDQNRVLDLRFGITRYEEGSRDVGSGFDLTKLGFPASLAAQLSLPSFPRITGIAGDFGSNQANSFTNTTYYSWQANLTHVHGNHTFRYGAEYWILQQAGGSVGVQPDFDFNNSNWTRQNNQNAGGTGVGSSFASFLLGLPNSGNAPVNAQSFYSQHYMGFYFQDDWRVTSRLTLNLGLRWDFERPVQERYDRLTDRFDPTAINPISSPAQAAYASILANPANASNAGVQMLKQLVPAANFQVPGEQLFAGVNGTPRTPVNGDYNQWQPRIGFAYRITPNTVLRGGVGRFTQASYITGGQNGFSRTTSLIATQDNYLTPYDTLNNPFRGGVLPPTGAALGPLTNLGSGPNWDDPSLGRFNSWEYSVHLQHQVRRWLFEAGYSHNKTSNIAVGWNQNLPSFPLWQQLQAPQFDASGRPVDTLRWNVQVPNPFYQLPGVTGGSIGSSKTVALNQLLNPIPLLGGVTQNRPTGSNQYDAALGKIEHRFANHFSVLASFTWSKLFEDTSFLGDQIAGARVEHKLGGEDRPLHFSIAPIYDLPFGRGRKYGSSAPRWVDSLIGGWRLTGTYNIQSGVPVVFGTNSFFTGNDVALPHDKQSLNEWFDTTQFVAFPSKTTDISNYPAWTGVQNLPGANYKPAAGDSIKNGVYQDFANFVRYHPTRWSDVRASRVNSVDIGVRKSLRLTEQTHLELRIDAFNAFNHPRFGAPNTDPTSANFGRVTPAQENQSRSVELAGKLFF